MCLTKHLKDSGCHKNSWKSLGKLGNIIASPEVGEWKYTNEITVLYKKEAYMERKRQFHLSGRLWRPGRRCLQNKNSHFSKCVSHLQRQMRKDQKRKFPMPLNLPFNRPKAISTTSLVMLYFMLKLRSSEVRFPRSIYGFISQLLRA